MAGTTMTILDGLGGSKTAQLITAPGTQADADSSPVAFSTEGKAQLGSITETAPASDTASSGISGRLQRVAQRITSLIALLPASLGSKADAASLAVTQSTEDKVIFAATNTKLDTLHTDITATNAQLPTALGTQADSASLAVAFTTEGKAQLGSITETAPASDTASSGISGRLQRIAQRLTSLIALLPAALGATTKSASLSVALATDSPQLPTTAAGSVQSTITRPANVTQYAAGDVVGGAITLPTGLTSSQRCMLTSMDLMLQIAALPGTPGMTTLDVHFYNVTPPSALADNAVFDIPSGDRASYLGKVTLPTPTDYGATLMSQLDNINKAFQMSGSASLFCYLVTTTSFTPANNSEVYLLRGHFLGL